MEKKYSINVKNDHNEVLQSHLIETNSLKKIKPITIKAKKGFIYQLVDTEQGIAPQTIRVKRVKNNLQIFLEDSENANIVIEDYYNKDIFGDSQITGQLKDGSIHEYYPNDCVSEHTIPKLVTNSEASVVSLEGGHCFFVFPYWLGATAIGAGLLLAGSLFSHSSSNSSNIAQDTTAPNAPTAGLATTSDSGTVGDGITNDNTPTITGTGTPGDTITLYAPDGTTPIGTATVASDGTWSITPTTPLADGLQNLSVKEKDPAGNESAATPLPITIDTTAPNAPTAGLATTSDSGTVGDGITNDNTPTITGTGTPGDTITLYAPDGTTPIGTATVASDGTWSITPTTPLADGLQNLSVKEKDPAGNESAATPLPITIDTSAPSAPTGGLTHDSTSDTGVSLSDNITGNRHPELSGTAEINATVEVTLNGVTYTTIADNNGNWSFFVPTSNNLPDGTYTPSIKVTDSAGNSTISNGTPFTVSADLTIVGHIVAGPVSGGVTVYAYDKDGNLLGQSEVLTDGSYRILVSNQGDYTGAILLKAVDSNATAANFLDEYTGVNKSLDSTLRAMSIADNTNNLYINRIDSNTAQITINITPITELAVVSAGVSSDIPPLNTTIQTTNTNVATALGLSGIDITGSVIATNSSDFQATTVSEVSDAEKYGVVLAKLSALDNTTGSISATIEQLSNNLTGSTLNATGVSLMDQGRIDALKSLLATDAVISGGATTLNRQLLGDIVVENQTSDVSGLMTITATALPGSTITVIFPDGSTKNVTVPNSGVFSVTSDVAQTGAAVSLQGKDVVNFASGAVSFAGNHAIASLLARLDNTSDTGIKGDSQTTDTTPTISGKGEPGFTITVTMPVTGESLTATVANDGTWSVTPTQDIQLGTTAFAKVTTSYNGVVSEQVMVKLIVSNLPTVSNVSIAQTSDSGIVGDSITNDNTPTISGTGIAGEKMRVVMPGTGEVLETVVQSNGTWSVTPTQALSEAPANGITGYAKITAIDSNGISSPETLLPIIIDTLPRSAPVHAPDLVTQDDSGTSAFDNLTSENQPIFNFDGTPGYIPSLYLNGVKVAIDLNAFNNNGVLRPVLPIKDGTYMVQYALTDVAGNDSPLSPSLNITIDTTPPSTPGVMISEASNGVSAAEKISDGGVPLTIILGKDVKVGDIVTTVITRPDNTTFTLITTLSQNDIDLGEITQLAPVVDIPSDGHYTTSTKITDVAGNIGESQVSGFTLAATPPTITLNQITDDNIINASEKLGDVKIGGSTNAGIGQEVTLVLKNSAGVVLHTYTAVVQPDGTFSTNIPQNDIPIDGDYTLVSNVSNVAGTPAIEETQIFKVDATAPTITLNIIAGNGILESAEAHSNFPITGTTTAEIGQEVKITLDGVTYTGIVVSGVTVGTNLFSINVPRNAAENLVHGNTYISNASVSDIAGNFAITTGNLVINIATPDIPTITAQKTGDSTPTITGIAQKLDGSNNPIALANGDTISITVNGVTITGTIGGTMNGITYDAINHTWSYTVPTALANGVYDVSVGLTTTADPSNPKIDVSTNELKIDNTPPVIVFDPISTDGIINAIEKNQALTISGKTDADIGSTVTIIGLDGTTRTATVVAGPNGSRIFSLTIPGDEVKNFTDGNKTLSASVVNGYGITGSATTPVIVDFTPPSAPVVDIPEAADTFINLTEKVSDSGVPIISTLPSDAVAGDTIITVVTKPDGTTLTLTHILTASDISSGSVSQLIPSANMDIDGSYETTTVLIDVNGNTSESTSKTFILDTNAPGTPVVNIPEANDGYINAIEKASDGGVPIISTLPGNAAVGDTLTTVVTKPDGSTLTLTHILTVDDITAGSVTQLLVSSQMATDGIYSSSTTLKDPAGNESEPSLQGFTLDTNPPVTPSIPDLITSSDTGSNTSDNKTADNTPTFDIGTPSGVVNAKLFVDGVEVDAIYNPTTGEITPKTLLSDGPHDIKVQYVDAAGNISALSPALPIVIDTISPNAPGTLVISEALSNTVGGNIVNSSEVNSLGGTPITIPINGTGAIIGDTVTLTVTAPDGSKSLVTHILTADDITAGSIDLIVPSSTMGPNKDGTYNISARIVDDSGNASAPTTGSYVVDTTAPDAPNAVLDSSSDTDLLGDNATSDRTPTISGVGTAGDTITVKMPTGEVLTTTVASDGTWSVTPTQALNVSATPQNVTIQATDPAGNKSALSNLPLTIYDGTPLSAVLDPLSDSGIVGDKITNDSTPTIKGIGTAGAPIQVTFPTGEILTTTVASDGTWSVTPTQALNAGLNNIKVEDTGSGVVKTLPITIDTTAPNAPTAGLATTSDSGTVGDGITNDNTPTITGTGTPGDTITLYAPDGTTPIGTATVASDGTWSITPTTPLADGLQNLSVKEKDPAGNESAATPLPITIDTSAPSAPSVSIPEAIDNIVNAAEKVSDGGVPIVSTLPSDAVAGDVITTVVTKPNGTTVTLSHTLTAADITAGSVSQLLPSSDLSSDGSYTTSTTIKDVAGNESTATTKTFTLDTTAPNAPTAGLATTSDSGTVGDGITNDNTPTITGTGTPGDTITLYAPDGTTPIGTATVASDGTWSITPTTPLADGLQNLSVKEKDPAGNESAATPLPITIDTSAPSAPSVSIPEAIDNIVNAAEKVSDGGVPIVSTLPSDAVAGDVITTVVTKPNGTTVTLSHTLTAADITAGSVSQLLPSSDLSSDGSYTTSTTIKDVAGNESTATTKTFTLDTTAPNAPTAGLATTSDSGTVGDGITNDNTPTITGTGTPGDTITVTLPTGEVLTTTVASDGTWNVTPSQSLTNGVNEVKITATDLAGNTSLPTLLPITIDTPSIIITSPISTNDSTPVITGVSNQGTATITVTIGGATYSVTPDANGNWSLDIGTAIPNGGTVPVSIASGDNSVTASVLTATANQTLALDNTPPSAPTATLDPSSDTGVQGDSKTNDNTPTISGSGATAGDTITLYAPDGTTPIGTTTVASDGTWSITPSLPLADGTQNLKVTEKDPAGNESTPTILPIIIDTVAPSAPVSAPDLTAASDTGSSNTDNNTSDNTPTFTVSTGQAAVKLLVDGVEVAATYDPTTGAITPNSPLSDGPHDITVKYVDDAGNASAASPQLNITIDTSAPSAPSVSIPEAIDNIVNAAEKVSDGGVPIVSTLPSDAVAGDVITTVVTKPNGTTVTLSHTLTAADITAGSVSQLLPSSDLSSDGSYTTSTTIKDVAGNESTATTKTFTLDTTAPNAPTAGLATTSDSGTVGDGITNDNTPTITGTGTPGDTITLYAPDGTTPIGTATVASDGTWSITPTTPLADGLQNLSVKEKDPAGNESAATPLPITIDTSAPSAPSVSIPEAIDNIVNAAEKVSDGGVPIVSTLPSDAVAGDVITTVVTKPNGTTVTLSHTLTAADITAGSVSQLLPSSDLSSDGSYTTSTTIKDVAGNESTATTKTFTLDTTAPNAPTAGLATTSDSGTVGDGITNDNTPTITGTGTPGDTITLYAPDGTTPIGTATVASDGTWSITPTTPLADGLQNLSVKEKDPAGNESAATPLPITIDTAVPTTPTVREMTTSDTTPIITGTATLIAGDTLLVTVNGATYEVITDSAGNWSVDTATATPVSGTLGAFVNGQTYQVVATVTDLAGNSKTDTSTGELIIDTSLPSTPTANLATGSDTGISNSDHITSDNTPTITGTGTPGDTITLYAPNGTTPIGTATVASDGTWSITPTTPLADGTQNLKVTATNNGHESAPAILPIVIDTQISAPTAGLATTSDSGTVGDGITNDNTPTITGTGTPGDTITLYAPDGTTPIGTATVASDGTWSITPTTPLADGLQNLSVKEKDPAGNESAATAVPITIDTTAPSTPSAPDLTAASDTGSSNTDNNTSDNTPTFTVATGQTAVKLLVDGVEVAATYDPTTGVIMPNSPLSDGTHNVTVKYVDDAGNVSSESPALSVVIDTTSSSAPTVLIPEASGGVNATEAANGVDLVVTLSSDAKVGDVVTTVVTGPGGVTITLTTTLTASDLPASQGGTATGSGPFTITQTVPQTTLNGNGGAYIDGAWTTSSTITDKAGNVSSADTDGFNLNTAAPTITLSTVAGDNVINANEAQGSVPVTGTTTAEAGQTVTVKLMNGSTVVGTYTAIVQPDGSYSTAIPQNAILADGNYTITADVSNLAGTPAVQGTSSVKVDTTAPAIEVTSISGDTVSGSANGTLDVPEHTALVNSSTQTVVISGTTDAEDGQTVTVIINNKSYTATVASGAWSAEVSNTDALALQHGNTYSIKASVSDVAGNTASDNNNALIANIAAPDIPTVVEKYTGTLTPTITGTAKKDAGSSTYIDLASGDTLSVTVNSVIYSLTIGSTSSPAGLTYASGVWSLAIPSGNITANGNYEVAVSATAGGATKSDISSTELHINTTPPTITLNSISGGTINSSESTQSLPITGTTDATVGSTVTVTIGGQNYTAVVQVGGTFSVTVPSSVVDALAEGTQTATASVTNQYGVTGTDSETVLVDTIAPGAATVTITEGPVVNATEKTSNSGTPLHVGLPSGSAVGDVVTTVVTKPDGTVLVLTHTLDATDISNGSIDQIIPTADLNADGSWTTSTTIKDTAGNIGAATAGSFTLDATAPAAPIADVATSSDTGSNNTDNITSDNTPTITGTGTPGDTITLYAPDGTTALGTATVASDGTWSITPTTPLAEGTQNLKVSETDPAGNVSPQTTVPVIIDTTAPSAPTVTASISTTTTPVISGTATVGAGETLSVTVNGATYIVTPDANGNWSINTATDTPSSGTLGAFSSGSSYPVTATITDAAGNATSDTTTNELNIAAVGPTAHLATSSDSGIIGDNKTSDTTPTISGSGQPGAVIKLYAPNGTTLLGTATVGSDGTWSITPTTPLADGLQNLKFTSTENGTTSSPITVPVTIDTTASITITSVAGDAVAAAGNGNFSISERGFDSTTYVLNSTVTTPPTISGTSDAESGSTVTITLNSKTYTTTVNSSGSWSYTLSDADAKLLNHGNSYAITASVKDASANTGTDTNNGIDINIAPPDVPTVNNAFNLSTLVPTITGTAQKLDNLSNILKLETGDILTVVLKDLSGTQLATYTLTVGANNVTTGTGGTGVNLNTELSYDKTTGIWNLGGSNGIPTGVFTRAGAYNVEVTTSVPDGSNPRLIRNDISSSEITILPTAPIIDATAWATTNTTSDLTGIQEALYDRNSATFNTAAGVIDNRLYFSEASSGALGTVIRVQLPNGTGSIPVGAGDIVKVTWGDSTTTTDVTLTATNITAKYVDVTVPFSVIDTQGFGNVVVSAKLVVANTTIEAKTADLNVNYVFNLPLVDTGDGTSPAPDNFGFRINGRTGDKAGYSTSFGSGLNMIGDVNGDGYDDMVIFAGQAGSNTDKSAFVVFGQSGNINVDLSAIAAGNSTLGFQIKGVTNTIPIVAGHGDYNADGLDDFTISMGNGQNAGGILNNFVVYGRTNTATINLTSFGTAMSTDGFIVKMPSTTYTGTNLNILGDINGDGYEDVGMYETVNGQYLNYQIVYGSPDVTPATTARLTGGTTTNGYILGTGVADGTTGNTLGYSGGAVGADINGDGYNDVVSRVVLTSTGEAVIDVYFGSATGLTSMPTTTATSLGSTGYRITGLTSGNTAADRVYALGDINGDGLADIVTSYNGGATNGGTYVFFGKTTTSTYNALTLTSGTSTNGFFIKGLYGQASSVGDFNGDGLDDILVGQTTMVLNGQTTGGAYLIYGKTSSTVIDITNLQLSEGFRIDGVSNLDYAGRSVSGGGDINGDGFADLLISAADAISSTTGQTVNTTTSGGVEYVIYGGPDRINSLVFQPSNGDIIGTAADEAINGTSGNNQLVAGAGDDIITGNGGVDVMYGGAGNDTFVINSDNIAMLERNAGNDAQNIARIDGGTGIDTIKFDSGIFDLTQIRSSKVTEIERIDMSGGTGTLKMNLLEVLNLSTLDNAFNTTNGWAGGTISNSTWGAINRGSQVVVDGTADNNLYLADSWENLGTVTNNGLTYKVLQSTTAQAQVLVDNRVILHLVPSIVVSGSELVSGLNYNEADSAGTDIKISLVDTGAVLGNTLTLTWGSQTVTYTIQASDITNGFANIPLSRTQLITETPIGTTETVSASVVLSDGGSLNATSQVLSIDVDFVNPTAPTISTTAWAATGAANSSDISGIGEAKYVGTGVATHMTTGVVDNVLFNSEIIGNGTVVRVQLPTTGAVPPVVGDTITLNWGTGTPITHTIVTADLTAKYYDFTVPEATIRSQGYGHVDVSTKITSSSTGMYSISAVQNVDFEFDLPLALPADSSNPTYGYAINGTGTVATTNAVNNMWDALGGSVFNAGDMNGDGLGDIVVTDSANKKAYVIFGQTNNTAVDLSNLGTKGFVIQAGSSYYGFFNYGVATSDINGDGLNDIVLTMSTGAADVRQTVAFVVYGKSDTTTVQLTAINTAANSNGFKISDANIYSDLGSNGYMNGTTLGVLGGNGTPSNIGIYDAGDVNGDGFNDFVIGEDFAKTGGGGVNEPGRAFVLFGTSAGYNANIVLPAMSTNPTTMTNGFFINGNTTIGSEFGTSVSGGADVNGDGLDDMIIASEATATKTASAFVVFGKTGGATMDISSITSSTNTNGFQITDAAQTVSSTGTALTAIQKLTKVQMLGDVNGDGLADVAVSQYDRAVVVFGKTDGSSVSASAIAAGTSTQGFVIQGISTDGGFGYLSNAGDINGDGLADMFLNTNAGRGYLIFGQTGNSVINLTAPSITTVIPITDELGSASNAMMTAAGDINGDGFDDILVSVPTADPSTGANYGKAYIVYGGFSDVTSNVFQSSNGDIIGTTGDDTINGTSGNNQLVGGAGDDIITGNGGADVMYGGAGNDTFVINSDNISMLARNIGNSAQNIARIDGGTGIDTIKLDGASLVFDLSQIRPSVIEKVENIDITGSGANTVKLGLADVLQMGDNNIFNVNTSATDTKKQLMITGDNGDTVDFSDLANWTKATGANSTFVSNSHTYDVYNHNTSNVQVLIDQNINNVI